MKFFRQRSSSTMESRQGDIAQEQINDWQRIKLEEIMNEIKSDERAGAREIFQVLK